jgi:hypothetical protein
VQGVIAKLKVLSWHLPGGDKKKNKSAFIALLVFWLWSELGHTHSQISSIPSAAD